MDFELYKNVFDFYALKNLSFVVKEVFYFPFWWYSRGLWNLILRIKDFLADRERGLALRVWIENIFVPMFGQRDWVSRLISFFMRVFQIIIRSIALFLWLLLCLAVFLFYVALPPLVIYQIIFQLFL